MIAYSYRIAVFFLILYGTRRFSSTYCTESTHLICILISVKFRIFLITDRDRIYYPLPITLLYQSIVQVRIRFFAHSVHYT